MLPMRSPGELPARSNAATHTPPSGEPDESVIVPSSSAPSTIQASIDPCSVPEVTDNDSVLAADPVHADFQCWAGRPDPAGPSKRTV